MDGGSRKLESWILIAFTRRVTDRKIFIQEMLRVQENQQSGEMRSHIYANTVCRINRGVRSFG